MIRDDRPMMNAKDDRAWLVREFPERSHVFGRAMALAVWWGFLWSRRNRENA